LGVDRAALTPAVFFDRDGVVNALAPDPVTALLESPLAAADVELLPGAAAALARLREGGFRLVGVSNQPAAAKGTVRLADLEAVQARVEELLRAEGVVADGFRLCFHHPEGVVTELARACDCRKPAPGLLVRAAVDFGLDLERSWMVGDTDSDIAAGRAAGCRTILIEHPGSSHKRLVAEADVIAADLPAAASIILDRARR
jgi:D-glycero-D-manno-heptose 1,7-bisphosphate phosphatase